MTPEQLREAFEAKWIEDGGTQSGLKRNAEGQYLNRYAACSWIGFQWALEAFPPISPKQREVIDAAQLFIKVNRDNHMVWMDPDMDKLADAVDALKFEPFKDELTALKANDWSMTDEQAETMEAEIKTKIDAGEVIALKAKGEGYMKIGMCCACGDQVSKSKTILVNGVGYCPHCAEMLGFDADDEDEE